MHQAPRASQEVEDFFERWIEGSNDGRWDAVAAMMHPDIVLTDPMSPDPARGREEAIARAKGQYEPFPDGRVVMLGEPFVAIDGPELSYRWRFSGTHLRRIVPPGFAPTGQLLEVEGTSVLRFHDQQVIAVWMYFDTTQVARQVLAAPAAGGRLERLIAVSQRMRVRLRRGTSTSTGGSPGGQSAPRSAEPLR
jgi:predicted ester cyclase